MTAVPLNEVTILQIAFASIETPLPPWLSVLLQVFGGIGGVAAIISILNFYWSNLRFSARFYGILDIATKHIAFRDQCLKAELAAAPTENEQLESKREAYAALQRVKAYATLETQRLYWSRTMSQRIHKSGNYIRLRWPKENCLTPTQKLQWIYFKGMSVVLAIGAWLFIGSYWFYVSHDRHFIIEGLAEAFCSSVVMLVALNHNESAELMLYERKPRPASINVI